MCLAELPEKLNHCYQWHCYAGMSESGRGKLLPICIWICVVCNQSPVSLFPNSYILQRLVEIVVTQKVQMVFYIITVSSWFKCLEHKNKQTMHICARTKQKLFYIIFVSSLSGQGFTVRSFKILNYQQNTPGNLRLVLFIPLNAYNSSCYQLSCINFSF